MRLFAILGLVLAGISMVGCGSGSPSPESVVRAWSQSLDSEDNEAAANLFAPDARVIQGGQLIVLHSHADAVAWNAALPCSGQIVSISTRGDTATATFLLGDRKNSRCDGNPGSKASALFRVRKGKIILWHQTDGGGVPSGSGGEA